jgi:hypothetical protein
MSLNGPTPTSGDIRFRAAVKGIADIKRAQGARQQRKLEQLYRLAQAAAGLNETRPHWKPFSAKEKRQIFRVAVALADFYGKTLDEK